MNASVTYPDGAAHPGEDIPGAERLRGRTRDELAGAMTWFAWYSPGIYTAVMDWCDGEPINREPPVARPIRTALPGQRADLRSDAAAASKTPGAASVP